MAIELVWKVNGYTGAFMLELLGKVEADVGLFAASQMAGYLVMIPFLGVAAVVLPRLSPIAIGEEHHEARQALFGKTTRHLALLSCAVAVPLIVYRDAVLGMFGPEYYEASNVLLLIAISFLIICTFGIASPFLQFCGDERLVLGVVLCATVFDFLLAAMLIPYWGAEGAAVAFLARGVLVEATMLFLIWRLQGLVPFFTRVPAALKPALA
jgi:O-antigen/teichoic acid export membrane protein